VLTALVCTCLLHECPHALRHSSMGHTGSASMYTGQHCQGLAANCSTGLRTYQSTSSLHLLILRSYLEDKPLGCGQSEPSQMKQMIHTIRAAITEAVAVPMSARLQARESKWLTHHLNTWSCIGMDCCMPALMPAHMPGPLHCLSLQSLQTLIQRSAVESSRLYPVC